jgi:outer membrane receptor for ferrienterochelin and colicin
VNQSNQIFKGEQIQNFVEASDLLEMKKQKLIYGVAMNNEHFVKMYSPNDFIQSYLYTTLSAFVQHTWNITPKFLTEAGFRIDNHSKYGNFYLPRLSLFYRPNKKFSIRLGGGSGYKSPALFSKQTLDYRFNQITMPTLNIKPENSFGINTDINFHTHIGKILVNIDQAFYHTQIANAVMVKQNSNNFISFYNYNGQIKTDGTDTYIRLKLEELEWYFGINHTIGKYSVDNSFVPYFPQDKISTTLAYELEGIGRVGLEASYQANQYISASQKVNNYWFIALMMAKHFRWGSLVLNCENLGDYRQSKVEKLYSGTIQNPQFKGVWAPIDGRIFNLSLKINL